jgi:drug/metabolite transporter (DMT)-like permease
MEIPLWFTFALLAALFSGLNNFFKKVSAENKNDPKVVAFYFNLASAIIAFVIFLIFSDRELRLDLIFYGAVIGVSIAHIFNIIFKVRGLEALTTSTVLISLRFLMILSLFLVELFIFKSSFTIQDFLGIIIGFGALYLLIESKSDKKQDFKKGIRAVLICVGAMTIISTIRKGVALEQYDQFTYYFFIFTFSLLISAIMNYKLIQDKSIFKNRNGVILYPSLQASTNFVAQMLGFFSLVHGANLVIYAKISSFSIFIPIILAIIIYKEKVTIKKLVAFGLTIVSLGLFL